MDAALPTLAPAALRQGAAVFSWMGRMRWARRSQARAPAPAPRVVHAAAAPGVCSDPGLTRPSSHPLLVSSLHAASTLRLAWRSRLTSLGTTARLAGSPARRWWELLGASQPCCSHPAGRGGGWRTHAWMLCMRRGHPPRLCRCAGERAELLGCGCGCGCRCMQAWKPAAAHAAALPALLGGSPGSPASPAAWGPAGLLPCAASHVPPLHPGPTERVRAGSLLAGSWGAAAAVRCRAPAGRSGGALAVGAGHACAGVWDARRGRLLHPRVRSGPLPLVRAPDPYPHPHLNPNPNPNPVCAA